MTNVLAILQDSPALLASAAEELARCRKAVELATHHWGVARSAATINHQEAKNQTILNALVNNDLQVQRHAIEIIEAEAAYQVAKIKHDEIYNRFISARKLAGIDPMELQAIQGSTISVRPSQPEA